MNKTADVKILRATEKDIKELAQIYAKIWKKLGENWTKTTAKIVMEDFIKSQPDLIFKAVVDGKIVGGSMAKVKHYLGIKLSDTELFVLPEYRNQKVGKKLLQKLIQEGVKKYHVKIFEGITDGRKEFPLKWYEKIGFKKTGYIHIEGNTKEILKNLKEEK